jgi:hypothetical protein
MFVRVLIIFVGLISLVSCTTGGTTSSETSSPLGPSVISDPPNLPRAAVPSGTMARAAGGNVIVNIHDNCDPETFDAAIGPGTCVGPGGMQFDQFISLLTKLHLVPSWHFAPNLVNAHTGENFFVINKGGEVHTFTEVEEFGGGIVPILNQLAGLPNVAPECLSLAPGDFIAPGSTFEDEIEQDEAEKYQCCIHPWMRLTTKVKETP